MPAVLPAAARGCAALLTGVSRRAAGTARGLLAGGGATASGVGALADDMARSSRVNSEAVAGLVRTEVERSLGRLGLATSDDVRTLSARLAAVEAAARTPAAPRPSKAAPARPARRGAPATAGSGGTAPSDGGESRSGAPS